MLRLRSRTRCLRSQRLLLERDSSTATQRRVVLGQRVLLVSQVALVLLVVQQPHSPQAETSWPAPPATPQPAEDRYGSPDRCESLPHTPGSTSPKAATGVALHPPADPADSVPGTSAPPRASSRRRSECVPAQSGSVAGSGTSPPGPVAPQWSADGRLRSQTPSRSTPAPSRLVEESRRRSGGRSPSPPRTFLPRPACPPAPVAPSASSARPSLARWRAVRSLPGPPAVAPDSCWPALCCRPIWQRAQARPTRPHCKGQPATHAARFALPGPSGHAPQTHTPCPTEPASRARWFALWMVGLASLSWPAAWSAKGPALLAGRTTLPAPRRRVESQGPRDVFHKLSSSS